MMMKIKNLQPNEILTTKDFPVHNSHILKIYFRICAKGHQKILPPTPVMPISNGLPLLDGKSKKILEYNKRIKEYIKKNKRIKYILVDGNHKTTALTLTHKLIHSMILRTGKDISEVKDLIEAGEIFGIYKIDNIKTELKKMAKHFKDAKFFESVEDKTKRMVREKVIPKFMIDYYQRKLK